jgi:hypothetical protein
MCHIRSPHFNSITEFCLEARNPVSCLFCLVLVVAVLGITLRALCSLDERAPYRLARPLVLLLLVLFFMILSRPVLTKVFPPLLPK